METALGAPALSWQARHGGACPSGGDHDWFDSGFGNQSCSKCGAVKEGR